MHSQALLAVAAVAVGAYVVYRATRELSNVGTGLLAGAQATSSAAALSVWPTLNPTAARIEEWLTAPTIIRDGRVISSVPAEVREVQARISAPRSVEQQIAAPPTWWDGSYLDPTAPID